MRFCQYKWVFVNTSEFFGITYFWMLYKTLVLTPEVVVLVSPLVSFPVVKSSNKDPAVDSGVRPYYKLLEFWLFEIKILHSQHIKTRLTKDNDNLKHRHSTLLNVFVIYSLLAISETVFLNRKEWL